MYLNIDLFTYSRERSKDLNKSTFCIVYLNIDLFTYSSEGGKSLNDLKFGTFIGSFPGDDALKG